MPTAVTTIRARIQHQGASRATRTFRAAEFFAGIGLVRLALERQGWRVDYANDIDPLKAKMYRDNWGTDDHLHVGDIHQINPADVPSVELFTASFPCNDLSIAGKWAGLNGGQSSAFWGLIDLLGGMNDRRPPLVMLENVVGFLQSKGGRDFEAAMRALNELGYAVDAVILNAKHWTPQSRQRLFVMANRFPVETSALIESSVLRPEPLARFIESHPGIRWSIRQLPSPPKPRKQLSHILEDLPENDSRWWSRQRADYFMGQMSNRHAVLARLMMAQNKVCSATAFRRVRNGKSMAELRTDGIAGCLRTPRGGSGRQILFQAGHGRFRVRLLTPRECARLQGVPESYRIKVAPNQALFGFGDAVCVPAVEWLVKHYLSPLARGHAEPGLFDPS
jgi:DNA (cytosine-5)-methyltransferase 1